MNKPCFFYLICAFAVSINFFARASDAVAFPNGPASWTINLTDSPNHKGAPRSGPKLQKIDAIQDTQFLHNLATWSTGDKRDYWNIVGTDMFMVQETATSVTLKKTGPYATVPYLPACFDWVQPSLLQEKDPVAYEGKMCFHYKGIMPYSPSFGYGAAGETIMGEAWVDSKTHLPVALDDGELLATYTFKKETPAPLNLPPGYKELYQSYKN